MNKVPIYQFNFLLYFEIPFLVLLLLLPSCVPSANYSANVWITLQLKL